MEQRQLAIAAAVVLLLLGAAYYYYTQSGKAGNGNKHAGMAFDVQPIASSLAPGRGIHCYIGSETLPPDQMGVRASLHAGYAITNVGNRETSLPASVYLAVGNEILDEESLSYPYTPGALLFGTQKEFSFNAHEFRGAQFDPTKVYGGAVNFDFRLIYCEDCKDPVKEGIIIYRENTRNCTRLPCSACRPV